MDLKAAEAYDKEVGKLLRDIEKVSKAVELFGFDKPKVEEFLGKKFNNDEANRLITFYTQYMEVNEWKWRRVTPVPKRMKEQP